MNYFNIDFVVEERSVFVEVTRVFFKNNQILKTVQNERAFDKHDWANNHIACGRTESEEAEAGSVSKEFWLSRWVSVLTFSRLTILHGSLYWHHNANFMSGSSLLYPDRMGFGVEDKLIQRNQIIVGED